MVDIEAMDREHGANRDDGGKTRSNTGMPLSVDLIEE